ncbi:MAG: hypothetical protein ACRDWE_09615 [Acidimicrobiales bacterium]
MAKLGFGKSASQGDGVRKQGTDALQLVVDYVKQETLSPLKGLGRYLLFGIVGSLTLCAGLILLLIALLRALQTELATTFGGDLTWLPYVVVCAAAALVMAFAAWRITKGASVRRRRPAGGR